MSLVLLKNEQREHLKIIREKSTDVVVDLCKLAFEYLHNGPNEKKYAAVAKKINISPSLMQPTIEALVGLLINATRANVSEAEFEKLQMSGFSSDHISILWQFVINKRNFIENVLNKTGNREYRYRDIEWRLEAKIASRSALYQATPLITLKFHLDTENLHENRSTIKSDSKKIEKYAKKEVLVQIDPNNLTHLIDVLEQALVELKIHRTRQIFKVLQ